MSVNKINFNSDIAERDLSFYHSVDLPLISQISSANIGCLYHGGEKEVVQKATQECHRQGVSIGAHISFLDKDNFGRTQIDWNEELIHTLIKEQISILSNLKDPQISITHIKPHGALNNLACKDPKLARVIVSYVKHYNPKLVMLAPVCSELAKASEAAGLDTALEVFADRTYEDDGTLTPRSIEDSLITDPSQASDHVKRMIEEKAIITRSGKKLPITIHSICLHSDTPNSVEISNQICTLLDSMGIQQQTLPELF
tara:strand:+ start:4460 stop:5230 length:771 start_codon:yes stop_codon:yes gene_type:complete